MSALTINGFADMFLKKFSDTIRIDSENRVCSVCDEPALEVKSKDTGNWEIQPCPVCGRKEDLRSEKEKQLETEIKCARLKAQADEYREEKNRHKKKYAPMPKHFGDVGTADMDEEI